MEIVTHNYALLDLPLYALGSVLSFLDATSLYNLSKTCSYLRDCIEDPALWKYIDARNIPNTTIKLLYCTEKIHRKTSHVFFTSKSGNGQIPIYFFNKIQHFTNLRILSLEYQKLSGFGVTLKQFPPCLEELSLKGTVLKMRDSVSFFQHSSGNMEALRVLILDSCTWITCSFLISVAKFKNLEIISVVNCPRIHLHTVPYLNVAKYGLKKLKIFDCRFTGIGAELIHTFYSKETIQKFYFQSVNCVQVDYKMNYPGNSKLQLFSENYVDFQILDSSLLQYHRLASAMTTTERICDSVLYEDPYPSCTCGHKDYHENGQELDCEMSEEDILISHVTKFICEKHLKEMKNLPEGFRDFCLSSQRDRSQVSEMIDEEDSSDEEEFTCCTIGTTSKMVILPNINDPSRRQEIVIPGNSSKFAGRQMNILIVNPLGERENALRTLDNGNPLERVPNPMGLLNYRNPLIRVQNLVNENRQNENIENGDIGRQNGNENQNSQHTAAGQVEIRTTENMTNENQDNKNDQHPRNESNQKGNEMVKDENENNENRLNEISQNRFMAMLNLPGTSRGILENFMNENTENSRMEVERLQSESVKNDSDCIDINKCSSQKYCDSKKITGNEQDESKQVNKTTNVSPHTTSSVSNNVAVIEKSLFVPTGSSSNAPSCSGVVRKKLCDESGTDDDNKKRQSRKRSIVCDRDNSSSDDDSNRSVQCVKVLLLDRNIQNPNRDSSAIQDPIPMPNNDNAQPSTSGCQRNIRVAETMQGTVESPAVQLLQEGYRDMTAQTSRPDADRRWRSETARLFYREIPDIHGGNPIRVLRLRQIIEAVENTRRINITHRFPNDVAVDLRLRYQLPTSPHKISLKYLSLRGYKKITDKTLYYLKHLNMELLDLTYTSVTRKGIEQFLLENPNCRIVHQNYCRCKPKNPF